MKIIFISYFILVALQVLYSQTNQTITIKSAVELALTNSPSLRESSGKLKEAQARVALAGDPQLPNVGISGSYLRIVPPNVKFTGEDDGSGSGDDSPFAAFSDLNSVALGQFSASAPLFAGFKNRNNKMMAEYLEQAATFDSQTTRSEVILNTLKAVYQLYELQHTLEVVEENLKQSQQRVSEFKNLEDQGLLPRNDRLKAELQSNNIELGLTEVNHNVQLAEYNLILMLGLSDNTVIDLDTTGMFSTPAQNSWEIYLQQGLDQHTELKSADLQVKASEMNYRVARAERFPSISLSAGYVNAYVPNVVTISNAVNAGISLKYSLTGIIHANHRMHEADAQHDMALARQQSITDKTKKEIKQKFLASETARDKMQITERAITQAEENFQITENKYHEGLVLLSDYLDASWQLLQAKINFTTAHGDAMVAYFELQQSTGNLNGLE